MRAASCCTRTGAGSAPDQVGQIWFRSLLGMDFEYHNAPEKTAAAHREPGVGTLGDVGYLDDDGYLFLSDRKIDMIISGGVNIYPAEIEGVLAGHPAVADVAVFGIPDEEMGERVHGGGRADRGTRRDARARGRSSKRTAAPTWRGTSALARWEFVDALPRNEAGKLAKRTLREPYWTDTARSI